MKIHSGRWCPWTAVTVLALAVACGGDGSNGNPDAGDDLGIDVVIAVDYGTDTSGKDPGFVDPGPTDPGLSDPATQDPGLEDEAGADTGTDDIAVLDLLPETTPDVADPAPETTEDTLPDTAGDLATDEGPFTPAIGWCRLQWPIAVDTVPGTQTDFFGRVFVAGLTDGSAAVDVHPLVQGALGVGPVGSDPTAGGWTWLDAVPNPTWNGGEAGEAANDEYTATFAATVPGTFSTAFRFSADGGQTWTLCDSDAGEGHDGSEDGFQPDKAGTLKVVDPCDPNPCQTPPASTCAEDGHTRNGWATEGTCSMKDGAPECTYAPAVTDCKDLGDVCQDGACVDPPDACAPNPCDAPPPSVCDETGAQRITFPAIGNCTQDYTTAVCDYPPTTIGCGPGEMCRYGDCVAGPPTSPGQVVVTEYMAKSQSGDDPGEWIELFNAGAYPVDLAGCLLADAGSDAFTVPSPLVVAAGGYIVLGRSLDPSLNHGAPVDVAYGGKFNLSNSGDVIVLTCGDFEMDRVTVAASPSAVTGIAMQLSPGMYGEGADPANWCGSIPVYGTAAKHGTPKAENPDCRRVPDWCRLQAPTSLAVLTGSQITTYGRLFVSGLTDLTSGVDLYLLMKAQAGVGPDGTDPAAGNGWTWTSAAATQDWNGASWPGEEDNDEYTATFAVPSKGAWDLAFRFSLDGGATWLYCDGNAGAERDGSQDGYMAADAGALDVLAPCDPNPCTAPEPATCDATGLKVVSHPSPGTCTVVDLKAECEYATLETACDPGKVCTAGACDDPCDPNPCTVPPAPACDPDGVTLISHADTGTCAVEGAQTKCTYTQTLTDCGATLRTCKDGACFGEAMGMPSEAGEVLVTEYMAATNDGGSDDGEWIEVFNASERPLNLVGCLLKDDGLDSHAIAGTLSLLPGEYRVLGRSKDPSANLGAPVDYAYSDFSLEDGGDQIEIACDGVVIDRVQYDADTVVIGVATQLDPAMLGPYENDDPASWCLSLAGYGTGGMYGTPGQDNPECRSNVGWCRLQWPPTLNATAGSESDFVYGRVWVQGITDRTTGTDPMPALVGEIGYGPDGSNPDGSTDWEWFPADPNGGFNAGSGTEKNNDEYLGRLIPTAGGTFDFAARFSLDGGQSWTYCDGDLRMIGGADGSADGYQTQGAGTLVVADPCDPNPCTEPPAAECDADTKTLRTSKATGTCSVADGQPSCLYENDTPVDCSATGQMCASGACADPNLYLTEYLEGSSNNKAVEVYNATGADVRMSNCTVKLSMNGGSSTQSVVLTDQVLPAGGTWVVCNSGIVDPPRMTTCNQLSANLAFNGDDAVMLICYSATVDNFGKVGTDPGSAWGTGMVSTADHTLRRKCLVSIGDRIGNDAFDPATEWEGFGADSFGDLGIRTCP